MVLEALLPQWLFYHQTWRHSHLERGNCAGKVTITHLNKFYVRSFKLKLLISTIAMPMVTNLARVGTYLEDFPHTVMWHVNPAVLWSHMRNPMRYISTCKRPMGNQTRQSVSLLREVRILKVKWPTDLRPTRGHVTN